MIIYYESPSCVSDIKAWNIACHEVACLLGDNFFGIPKLQSNVPMQSLMKESLSWISIYEGMLNETST